MLIRPDCRGATSLGHATKGIGDSTTQNRTPYRCALSGTANPWYPRAVAWGVKSSARHPQPDFLVD